VKRDVVDSAQAVAAATHITARLNTLVLMNLTASRLPFFSS
jgi:hypothetical protein